MNSDYNLEIPLIQDKLRIIIIKQDFMILNTSIKNSNKLSFIGDSITDTSQDRLIGQTVKAKTGHEDSSGLGRGYVSIINNLLNLTFHNSWVSYDRVCHDGIRNYGIGVINIFSYTLA